MAVATPLVYVNAPDGYLYELDGLTGDIRWRRPVAIPSASVNDYFAWSSPLRSSSGSRAR